MVYTIYLCQQAMKNLLRHITPFLVVSIYLVVLSIYTFITDGESWGGVAAIMMFFLAIILILVDLGLKKFIKKTKHIFITELIIGLVGYYML